MNARICRKCKAMAADGVCPLCGKSRKLTDAKPDDIVYLTSCGYIWSKTVEDILDEAGIKYYRHGSLGSGIIVSIGEMAELYRYYVAFSDYERAVSVIPDFSEPVMTEEELNEYIDREYVPGESE